MKRLIIVGSPRSNGRSAALAEMLFEACIDECPEDEVTLVPVAEVEVAPCDGCGACEHSEDHVCTIADDMDEIRAFIDEADELTVVSPVYFSGAPSQMKALLDRFQPYFWTWERGGARRPMTLHVVGEGGDPNGFDALISEVRSAGAVAGFRLERVVSWVGKISAEGVIEAEGEEYVPAGAAIEFARIEADDVEHVHVLHEEALRAARKAKKKANAQAKKQAEKQASEAAPAPAVAAGSAAVSAPGPAPAPDSAPHERPKLSLGAQQSGSGKGKGGSGKSQGGKGGQRRG